MAQIVEASERCDSDAGVVRSRRANFPEGARRRTLPFGLVHFSRLVAVRTPDIQDARVPVDVDRSLTALPDLFGLVRIDRLTVGKCRGPENRSNKPKPLPPVATSCRGTLMVRRGSPVRVRKRALSSRKYLQIG